MAEGAWISRLDFEEESTSKPYFSLDIMRCKICLEVFYVKHHESHPCFSKNTVEQHHQKEEDRDLLEESSKSEEKIVDMPDHIFQNHEDRHLEEALNIKPVVKKVWRLSYVMLLERENLFWMDG